MLLSKHKCMLIGTTLGKPLLNIGLMLTITMFHFIQLGIFQIFTLFGDFSLFRSQWVNAVGLSSICH
jgi:hypothetical protein